MRINEMWNCGFICYLAVTKSDWLPSNEKTWPTWFMCNAENSAKDRGAEISATG
jgi:hypothetical protein